MKGMNLSIRGALIRGTRYEVRGTRLLRGERREERGERNVTWQRWACKVFSYLVPRTSYLVTLLLLPLSATAQIGQHRDEFAVGVSAGYVMSQVNFKPDVQQGWLGSPTVGLTMRYTTEKYFSSVCAIVGEVNYARIGWKQKILTLTDEPVINQETQQAEEYERRIGYVQVPLMARLGWGRERKGMQFFFQVGPQMGFYLNEKTVANYELAKRNINMRSSVVVEQETMPIENKFDYGIAGGIGLEYSHPKLGHFLVEGRYYFGLGNIYGNSKRDFFARSNYANIMVKASWLFDVAKTKNDKIK